MVYRPLITVTYELHLITEEGEVMERFVIDYDSDLYDSNMEATDSIYIKMKTEDLKGKYGDDLLLLEYTIDREKRIVN